MTEKYHGMTRQLVDRWWEFDQRHWMHARGIDTVEHSLLHLGQSLPQAYRVLATPPRTVLVGLRTTQSFIAQRVATRALVGRMFDWVARLGFEAFDGDAQALADWMDSEFERARSAIPLGGVEDLLIQEAFYERSTLLEFVHAHAHGDALVPEKLRHALRIYLSHLMTIGVVATRLLIALDTTCGMNDVNRDPSILSNLWFHTARKHYETTCERMKAA